MNGRVHTTHTTHRALFESIVEQAKKRGYRTSKVAKALRVADGAEVPWTPQHEFFPDGLVRLDWPHVAKRLWEVGKAVCRGTRPSARSLRPWSQSRRRCSGLARSTPSSGNSPGGSTPPPPAGPGNRCRRTVLAKIASHLERSIGRLRHGRLRGQDLGTRSGAVEGAVRDLVCARLDAPRMRWGKGRADAVPQPRCASIKGLWNDFEAPLARKVGFRVTGASQGPDARHYHEEGCLNALRGVGGRRGKCDLHSNWMHWPRGACFVVATGV